MRFDRDLQTQPTEMPIPRPQQRQPFAVAFICGFLAACVTLWFVRPHSGTSDVLSALTGAHSAGGLSLWQTDDANFLGPQKGDTPPARLDNYKYKTNEYQASLCCYIHLPHRRLFTNETSVRSRSQDLWPPAAWRPNSKLQSLL